MMIVNTIVVSLFQMNCFLVASEETKKGFIIDPGDEADRIISEAENSGITVEKIVNTHGHIDHACAAKELKDKLDVPFYIHKDDEFILDMILESAARYGMTTMGKPEIEGYLEDGDSFSVPGLDFKVIHTPGHSPGGICLHGHGVVFTGDTLFNSSIGRTDLWGGSYEILINSIRNKLMDLNEKTVVHCGHGPDSKIGFEKQYNPFLNSL